MRFRWATASHVGQVREANEDSVHPEADGAGDGPLLVAVADGLGGHVAGEVASRLAIQAAAATGGDVAARVQAGNAAVVARVREQPELAGMGTTLTLAELTGNEAAIGHVGDSRAYLLRSGSLRQLTTDHSKMEELLSAGLITHDEVPTHPQRAMITRALGLAPDVEVDTVAERLEPGDRLLLCSDGLTSMVDDATIEQLLAGAASVEEAAWSLVDAANAAGGADNITVAVVDAGP